MAHSLGGSWIRKNSANRGSAEFLRIQLPESLTALPEGAATYQPRRPIAMGAPANASSASVCATLGNLSMYTNSPNGTAVTVLRATPFGVWLFRSSHPQGCVTFVPLTSLHPGLA